MRQDLAEKRELLEFLHQKTLPDEIVLSDKLLKCELFRLTLPQDSGYYETEISEYSIIPI
jgi:hypothetical protein